MQILLFFEIHFILMLGVGKAAPAQLLLHSKSNLRRTRAAGQKAGFMGMLLPAPKAHEVRQGPCRSPQGGLWDAGK